MATIERQLFKIFLLEDEEALRNDLQEIVQNRLPGTAVIGAGTIEEGLEILGEQRGFVLAILDVRVPMSSGMQPEAHPDVLFRLRELRVPSLFITSYRDSADVDTYLRSRSLIDAPAAVIEKSMFPGKLTSQLIAHIRPLLTQHASSQVTACLKSLFGPSVTASGPRSGTAAFIDSQGIIAANWPYLDDPTRQQVRSWFMVSESANGVDLSFLSQQGCE